MVKLTNEEKESLSYGDIAHLILKDIDKKLKIQDLFKKVIKALDLSDQDYENNIGIFFEEVITDKRFIMLDNGYCDLKVNHTSRIILEDDEDDFEIVSDDETIDNDSNEDNYDDDSEDEADDDLQDLVILDDNELDDSEV